MKSKSPVSPPKYGLICVTQLDEYCIDVTTPLWWTNLETATHDSLHFTLHEGSILVQLDANHHSAISEAEWWLYRISKLKDTAKSKDIVDVSDYEPCGIDLSDLFEEKRGSDIRAGKVSMEFLAYKVYLF